MSNYIHLFYQNFGKNPYLLIHQTKDSIGEAYKARISGSLETEKALQEILKMDVKEIVSSNKEAQQYFNLVSEISDILKTLRSNKEIIERNQQILSNVNTLVEKMQVIIDKATRSGYFVNDAVLELQKARDNIMKLTEKDPSKDLMSILDGLFNNFKGAVGEIAVTIAFAQASLKGLNKIQSVNIGAGKKIGNTEVLIKEDPCLQKDINDLNKALAEYKLQPKEDVHIFIRKNGSVDAQILNAGISAKVSNNGKKITVQSTTLNAILNNAYPEESEFLNNLIAGLGSDSSLSDNYGQQNGETSGTLMNAWQETIKNAYELRLIDFIAGNNSNGNRVNYLIINDKVYAMSHILYAVYKERKRVSKKGLSVNKMAQIKNNIIGQQIDLVNADSLPIERSQKIEKAINGILSETKIKISLRVFGIDEIVLPQDLTEEIF